MNNDIMISVKNLSVKYKVFNDKIRTLKEFLIAIFKGKISYKTFIALKNINFDLNKGDILGVIGHNGAGKSTLLKVLSGIIVPNDGKIKIKGNIVPLLELGSGFDFDLSGRENIFLNGAILGYKKEFLINKEKEIIEFSELGEFIDIPIRNYSSGMIVRLAFSIATIVEPEILIVDEILSVGDINFQEKSKKRMLEMMGGGTTVIFVSHDIEQIRRFCNKILWLDHGKIKQFGETEKVIKDYLIYMGQ